MGSTGPETNSSFSPLNRSFLEQITELISEVDSECRRLEELHSGLIVCKKGCSSCCMDFSIFPVEFFSIKEMLKGRKISINRDAPEGDCPMLVGGLCSIYEFRPFICRTHGLPLLSMGDDGWELTHCELNFISDTPDFDETNSLIHDRFNSRMFMLNREFIKTLKEVQYSEFDLVPIRMLICDPRQEVSDEK